MPHHFSVIFILILKSIIQIKSYFRKRKTLVHMGVNFYMSASSRAISLKPFELEQYALFFVYCTLMLIFSCLEHTIITCNDCLSSCLLLDHEEFDITESHSYSIHVYELIYRRKNLYAYYQLQYNTRKLTLNVCISVSYHCQNFLKSVQKSVIKNIILHQYVSKLFNSKNCERAQDIFPSQIIDACKIRYKLADYL